MRRAVLLCFALTACSSTPIEVRDSGYQAHEQSSDPDLRASGPALTLRITL